MLSGEGNENGEKKPAALKHGIRNPETETEYRIKYL